MKCIRCGDEIHHPDSSNAKYIINAADVRTHGPIVKETYVHKKGAAVVNEFEKIDMAKNSYETDVGSIDTDMKNILKTVPAVLDTDTPETKTSKMADINSKMASVELLKLEKSDHKIEVKQETIQIPKTGIICRKADCQDAGDTVIWG